MPSLVYRCCSLQCAAAALDVNIILLIAAMVWQSTCTLAVPLFMHALLLCARACAPAPCASMHRQSTPLAPRIGLWRGGHLGRWQPASALACAMQICSFEVYLITTDGMHNPVTGVQGNLMNSGGKGTGNFVHYSRGAVTDVTLARLQDTGWCAATSFKYPQPPMHVCTCVSRATFTSACPYRPAECLW